MFCNSKIRLIANVVELTLLMSFVVLTSSVVSAKEVRYNFMPGTDFSKYHTYKWVDIPSNVHTNQIVAQEIRDAVNNTLAAKGLTPATGDKADVYLGYQCSVDQEREWNASGMGGGPRWGGMGSGEFGDHERDAGRRFLRSYFEATSLARDVCTNAESKWEPAKGHGEVEQSGRQAVEAFSASIQVKRNSK